MIITFCGHSDYSKHKEDEERHCCCLKPLQAVGTLTFISEVTGNSMPLPKSVRRSTKKYIATQK